MRAVVCRELGPPSVLRLEEAPVPELSAGGILVRIRAVGVNFPDLLMVAGSYQLKPALPFTPGIEAAGIVEAVADDVDGWRPGDRAIVRLRPGTYAEYVAVAPDNLLPMPTGMNFPEAATFAVATSTAYLGLAVRGKLQAGEVLLVHGATGGVGMATVALGKELGATVIATGGDDAKLKIVQNYGADHVINYADGPFKETVKALTDDRGADVIFDTVGGDAFEQSLSCVNWGGRLLVVGFTQGRVPALPANYPLLKGCSVIGVRAGEYRRRDPEAGMRVSDAILRLGAAGKLWPHISHRLPLEQAGQALQLLADRKIVGRAALLVGDDERAP